jgi:hypothetical protein
MGEMAEWLWRCVQENLNKFRSGAIRVGSSPTLINQFIVSCPEEISLFGLGHIAVVGVCDPINRLVLQRTKRFSFGLCSSKHGLT